MAAVKPKPEAWTTPWAAPSHSAAKLRVRPPLAPLLPPWVWMRCCRSDLEHLARRLPASLERPPLAVVRGRQHRGRRRRRCAVRRRRAAVAAAGATHPQLELRVVQAVAPALLLARMLGAKSNSSSSSSRDH
jgi:hypothetical protein